MNNIENWTGEFEFLRNDFQCDIALEEDDGCTYTYPSAEAAFQAGKATDADDRDSFADCFDARDAKQLGRALPLPADWNTRRVERMEEVVRAKFTQNDDLAESLKKTGTAPLVMVNRRDEFWGMTRQPDGSLQGRNMLGNLLVQIRGELDPSLGHVKMPDIALPDIQPAQLTEIGGSAIDDLRSAVDDIATKTTATQALQRAVTLGVAGDLEGKLQKCGIEPELAKAMAELYEAGRKAAKEFGDGSESTLVGVVVTKIESNPNEYAKLVGDVGKAVENLAATVSKMGD